MQQSQKFGHISPARLVQTAENETTQSNDRCDRYESAMKYLMPTRKTASEENGSNAFVTNNYPENED